MGCVRLGQRLEGSEFFPLFSLFFSLSPPPVPLIPLHLDCGFGCGAGGSAIRGLWLALWCRCGSAGPWRFGLVLSCIEGVSARLHT